MGTGRAGEHKPAPPSGQLFPQLLEGFVLVNRAPAGEVARPRQTHHHTPPMKPQLPTKSRLQIVFFRSTFAAGGKLSLLVETDYRNNALSVRLQAAVL